MMIKWGEFNIEYFLKVEKKILILLGMVFLILVLGTITFVVLEHQPIEEAMFNTFASAVGHGFQFESRLTIIITAVIMILEWACLWTGFDIALELMSEGKVREVLGGFKMKRKVEKMKDHCILCGFGRVGSEIAKGLKETKKDLVVVEKDIHAAREALGKGYMVLEGDVVSEETLKSAGIERAKILIAAMGSDADNVFLTLTAKQLNPKIRIVARAERMESMKKLKQAGATEVVMPSAIGGKAMAEAVIKS